jgi:hypothetical protein
MSLLQSILSDLGTPRIRILALDRHPAGSIIPPNQELLYSYHTLHEICQHPYPSEPQALVLGHKHKRLHHLRTECPSTPRQSSMTIRRIVEIETSSISTSAAPSLPLQCPCSSIHDLCQPNLSCPKQQMVRPFLFH